MNTKPKFSKGQKVTMTSNALENYGSEYQDVALIITHVASRYMPAEKFFASGKPSDFHPGYDDSIPGQGLYDLRQEDGKDLNFSLYDWELRAV